MALINPFKPQRMRTALDSGAYDLALEQVRRSPADVTDEQLETLGERNPQFAKMAAAARDRHRRGAAYQQKIAGEAYEREANLRRLVHAMGNRLGKRQMSAEEIQRLADKSAGIVRMAPKRR